MALRIVGSGHVYSASNAALRGATAASAAFWIRFNPDSGTVTGGHATLLANDGWSPLTLFLSSGSPRQLNAWWNADGVGYGLPHGDATYHVATTYDAGAVKLYVNGFLVGSKTVTAPLASPAAGPFYLGPDGVAGLDITLDDPAIWQGYALTLADVRALRDRTAAPGDIAPASLAWHLTLDGTDGAAATVGDAGLADAGTLGADATTVSSPAPTYAAGPLIYETGRVRSARIGASGKTLALVIEDAAGDLTGFDSIAAHPTITVDGGDPIQLADPTWMPGLPYVAYPLADVVPAGAAVAITADEGWAATATQGVAPLAAAAVSNDAGRSYLPAFASATKTMATGFNLMNPAYWIGVPHYANSMKQATALLPVGGSTWTEDADGYPVAIDGGDGRVQCLPVFSPYPNGPAGTWTLRWDGAADATVEPISGQGSTATHLDSSGAPQATGNWRTYDVTYSGYGPQLAVLMAAGVTNVRLYGPDVADDDTQRFHPEVLRMLAGARCVRFMQAGFTVNSPVARAAHFARTTARSVSPEAPSVVAEVVSVAPESDPDGYFLDAADAGWFVVRFTTAAPHGFYTGQRVRITNLSPIALSDERTYDASAGATGGMIRVLSPTEFAAALWIDPPSPAVAGTQAATGTAAVQISSGMPHEDKAALCNAVGCDAWVCVPHALDDAGVTAMAAVMAATLDAGRKCRVEYSNECWNGAYDEHWYCVREGGQLGLSAMEWYAKRAGEVHALFRAAFAAAGRQADCIRVFGSMLSRPVATGEIVGYCAANGVPIDELAVAPYLNNGPIWFDELDARWDALDIEQLMDLSELYVQHSPIYADAFAGHADTLAADYPAARIVCYEGGPEDGCPNGTDGTTGPAGRAARSRMWARHPRIRGVVLRYLQQLQDQGCTLFIDYSLADLVGGIGRDDLNAMWPAYVAYGQPAGLGDGSDGKFDNRTDYEALDQIVSVVGGAFDTWEALAAGDVPGPPARRRLRLRRHA